MQVFLETRQPFILANTIRSHGWYQLAPFQAEEPYNSFAYTHQLGSGKTIDFAVAEAPGGVKIHSDRELSPDERQELSAKVSWMLGLEQNFTAFYQLAKDEPKLAHVIDQARGRVLRSATLFEDVVKTILTTNTTWSGTKRMVANIVNQYGSPLPDNPEKRAFPTAPQLAATNVESLRTQTRLGYRSPYVLALAQRVAGGELNLEAYKHSDLPTDKLRKELLALKGVGDYAAANLLMLLGRYDYLPVDSWARMMVSHEWYDGQKIGRAEVEAAFESWGPWKGLAYWFWDWKYNQS